MIGGSGLPCLSGTCLLQSPKDFSQKDETNSRRSFFYSEGVGFSQPRFARDECLIPICGRGPVREVALIGTLLVTAIPWVVSGTLLEDCGLPRPEDRGSEVGR